MKYFSLLTTLLFLLASCHNTPKINKLKLTDLKFADFEREAIAKNKVDTMFCVSNHIIPLWNRDAFEYCTYDTLGNKLIEEYGMCGGPYIEYSYDSLGLMKSIRPEDNSGTEETKATYNFMPSDRILFHFWAFPNDTDVFTFNENGNLVEERGRKKGRGWPCKTIYEYDKSNRLIREITTPLDSPSLKKTSASFPDKRVTNFFYANGILDSTVEIITPYQPSEVVNYSNKIFYKLNGLRDSMVTIVPQQFHELKDSITGIRSLADSKGIMDTIVIYYVYKTRIK